MTYEDILGSETIKDLNKKITEYREAIRQTKKIYNCYIANEIERALAEKGIKKGVLVTNFLFLGWGNVAEFVSVEPAHIRSVNLAVIKLRVILSNDRTVLIGVPGDKFEALERADENSL